MEIKLRKYPDSNIAVPLKNHVSLKPNADLKLMKLIDSFFSKIVLVKDYSTAMHVAKEFNLTCITPDK
jgi:hypothetical protein